MHITRKLQLIVIPAFLALLVLIALLPGCASPAYYSQAVSGHLGLMRQREDIDTLLLSPDLEPELRKRLELTKEVREFAVTDLGLPDNNSYSQFVETGREAVSWNVVAAPEFSLQPELWCFLVAGCVPYRGYFDRAKAEKFAAKLDAKGFDTSISGAAAYSTLGWFDDPLLDTMFSSSDEQLAGTLFHELAHQALYVKGDTAFNEAYARFVEELGVRQWLEANGASHLLPQWLKQERASLEFNELLTRHRSRLEMLYQEGLDDQQMRALKSQHFDRLHDDYRQMVEQQWDGQDFFGGWFQRDLNNAHLALMSSYESGACAFSALFEESGRSPRQFHEAAREKSRLDADARKAWLEQPCEDIALQPDL